MLSFAISAATDLATNADFKSILENNELKSFTAAIFFAETKKVKLILELKKLWCFLKIFHLFSLFSLLVYSDMDSFLEMPLVPGNQRPKPTKQEIDNIDNREPVLTDYDLIELAHAQANGGFAGVDSVYELSVANDGSPILTKDTGVRQGYCVLI